MQSQFFIRCILLFIFSFPSFAHAEIRSKLQWFDANGEIIDLDWPRNVQWIWSQEKIPSAQVIITVPEQLHLSSEDENAAKFLNGVPDREGKSSNRTLVVEMDGPRKTIKLKKVDVDSESKEIGLTLTLLTNTPNVVPSESCAKEGIAIEPRQEAANFLFLAASCKLMPSGLKITIETSHDALIAKDDEETAEAHYSADPFVIVFPKKALSLFKPEMVMETLRVESQNNPPMTTQFEIINRKDAAVRETGKLPKPAPVVAMPTPSETIPWIFNAEADLGYFGYLQSSGGAAFNPSEYNLGAKVTAEHSLFASSTHFIEELAVPLITFLPNTHFPASGFYQATSRLSFTIFDRGKIAFHVQPGFELNEARFHDRSEIEGFYGGPVLAVNLSGTAGFIHNRAIDLLISASPLAASRLTPFWNSWDVFTQLAVEMIKGDAERHWDLILRYRWLNLHDPSLNEAKASEASLGIRTGF